MAKKSILQLGTTLCDLGYYPKHINSYMQAIDQILQRGLVIVDRRSGMSSATDILQKETVTNDRRQGMLGAVGIRPLFKINPKSIDVFLRTTGEFNLLRIHHPSNPFCKGESEAGCYAGNQKWVAKNLWDKERGPDKGFYFT